MTEPVHAADPLAPPAPFAALLFDCDGTLVDTLPAYERAWERAFAATGYAMSGAWYRQRTGLSPDALVDAAVADDAHVADREAVQSLAARHFVELVEHVRCNDAVADVARSHHGRVPMAVVSGGPAVAVRAALAEAGVRDLFDSIVTIDDVVRGKPAPDLYLAALDKLGCGPTECVAYEDTDEGLAAARAAGIRCIDVRPFLATRGEPA